MILISTLLSGCATKNGNPHLEKMSQEKVSAQLIKGKTTKEEVKLSFGEPNDIDILPDGRENWQYSFVRSSLKGVAYIPYVNMVYNGTNDTTKKLKVLFDKQDKVEHYSFSVAQGETKRGLFQ
ncbi:MAG: hypothetical protein RLZ35_1194 [Pseudomonadota bacterium]